MAKCDSTFTGFHLTIFLSCKSKSLPLVIKIVIECEGFLPKFKLSELVFRMVMPSRLRIALLNLFFCTFSFTLKLNLNYSVCF